MIKLFKTFSYLFLIILLLFFLSLFFIFANACINDPTNLTEVQTSHSNNCFLNCSDINTLSVFCYSDIGISYSIWIWSYITASIFLFFWTIYCIYIIIQTKLHKNTFYFIIFANLITICMRLIWFIFRINGNSPHEIFSNYITDTIFLKIPQSFLFSELCGIIIVWKSIINSTTNYIIMTDHDYYKQYKFLIFFCIINAIIMICSNILALYIPIFMHISNSYAGIVILFLIIGSFRYSLSLRKILASFISANSITIRNIKFINDFCCALAIISICSIIVNTIGLLDNSILKFIGLVIPIHTCELFLMFNITNAVSYESRHNFKIKKNTIVPSTKNVSRNTTKKSTIIR